MESFCYVRVERNSARLYLENWPRASSEFFFIYYYVYQIDFSFDGMYFSNSLM